MEHKFVDPYVDPAMGVLRNLVGATSYDELRNAEGEFIALRTGEFLEQLSLKPTGSMKDFRKIHQHLFQDILCNACFPELRQQTWVNHGGFRLKIQEILECHVRLGTADQTLIGKII